MFYRQLYIYAACIVMDAGCAYIRPYVDGYMHAYVPSVPAPLRGPYHVAPPFVQPETLRGWSMRRQLMARAAKATKKEEAMLAAYKNGTNW
jgi:hypothetical protein